MPCAASHATGALLVPEITGYATDTVALGHELECLEQVRRARAHEAVVLYCARVLEGLAARALELAGLTPSPNLYSNLESLFQYNLLPLTTAYWATALRRVANDMRHIRRRTTAQDAEVAVLLLERWLAWYFGGFAYGPRLARLTVDGSPPRLAPQSSLRRLAEAMDESEPDLERVLGLLGEAVAEDATSPSPAVPAVVADLLIDRQRYDEAAQVLDTALQRFGGDQLLTQMRGLGCSRSGQLEQAQAWLEPLAAQFRDDEEVIGILAGVYRRRWLADRGATRWLEKAHDAYLHGWRRSRQNSAYLGVNAATTALWLGRRPQSIELARQVEQLLRQRLQGLARVETNRSPELSYWDRVSLAEALLLQGQLGMAWQVYHAAFAAQADRPGRIAVTVEQADELLAALGIPLAAAGFVQEPPPSEGQLGRLVDPSPGARAFGST